MKEFTYFGLIVLCTVFINIVFAISIGWYLGGLDELYNLYQDFGVPPSTLFSTVYPYAHLAWILPLIDTILLVGFSNVTKYRQWLWGVVIITFCQLVFMLATMYSTDVFNHGWD